MDEFAILFLQLAIVAALIPQIEVEVPADPRQSPADPRQDTGAVTFGPHREVTG